MFTPSIHAHPLKSAATLLALTLAVSITSIGCVHVNRRKAAAEPRQRQSREERKSFAAKPGMMVELINLAGHAQVEGTTGGEIEVVATLHAAHQTDAAAKALLEKLTVKYEDLGDRIRVRAVYPVDEHDSYYYPDWPGDTQDGRFVGIRIDGNSPDVIQSCGPAFFGGGCRISFRYQDNGVSVSGSPRRGGAALYADFHIRVPAGIGASIRNHVGNISVKRVEGAVTAETSAGNIVGGQGRGALTVSTGGGLIVIQDYAGNIRAESGSGDLHIVRIKGNVKAGTGSGEIKLEELEGEKINAETGSGNIIIERVSGSLHAETGSGDVTGSGYRSGSSVIADTGSGSVSLDGDLSAAKEINIDTGSGDVELVLSALPPVTINVSTGSGRIQVEVPELHGIKSEDNEYQAELGNGAATLKIDTGSGDASLKLGGKPPAPPAPPSFDALIPMPPAVATVPKPAKPAKPARPAKPAQPAQPAQPAGV